MLSPFVKSQIADVVIMVILAAFVALLWLDLRLIREEIGAMQHKRDFLTVRLVDLRINQEMEILSN